MDLMDFSALFFFFQDLDGTFFFMKEKKKKGEKPACLGSASKRAVDCRGQHFCLHQKNEKFSAYKTGADESIWI